jgi:hypothetical protein
VHALDAGRDEVSVRAKVDVGGHSEAILGRNHVIDKLLYRCRPRQRFVREADFDWSPRQSVRACSAVEVKHYREPGTAETAPHYRP